MSRCKISVIVPVYNAEEYLDETLSSIERQTCKDIEIICVNDCSTDSSLDVLLAHKQNDSRIKVVTNPVNSGSGTSINVGLNLAEGEYIQLVGNDDTLDEHALEFLYRLCTEKNLDFVQYGITIVLDDPNQPSLVKRSEVKERYHRIEHDYPIAIGTELLRLSVENDEYRMSNGPQFIRRSLLEKNAIRNIEGIGHEDMYFTYRVFLASRNCTIIPNAFYHYRIRTGSQEDGKKDRGHLVEEFNSLLSSSILMAEETPDELYFDPAFKETMDHVINRYYATCTRYYLKMDPNEQQELTASASRIETAFLASLEASKEALLKTQTKWEKKELKLRRSYSYRLGHAILAPFYGIYKTIKR